MNRHAFAEIMKGVRPHTLFFNVNTHTVDTYEKLTSWVKTDEEDYGRAEEEAMEYFEDLVRDEILIRVVEGHK